MFSYILLLCGLSIAFILKTNKNYFENSLSKYNYFTEFNVSKNGAIKSFPFILDLYGEFRTFEIKVNSHLENLDLKNVSNQNQRTGIFLVH